MRERVSGAIHLMGTGPVALFVDAALRQACGMSETLSSAERHARIWAVIKRIPRGRVATYGQVAAEAGFVKQPRLTAQALRHAPDELKLPWYRVINAQGKLSFPLDSDGYKRARTRLEAEGVVFVRGKIDFEIYRWRPRSAAPVLD